MSTVRKLSVSVSDDLAAMMSNAVAGGQYNSTSEVVREALRDWQYKQEMRAAELEALKQAYGEGKASGPGRAVDPASLLDGLKVDAHRRG